MSSKSDLQLSSHSYSLQPAVESAVTRLLVSIKQLLESLTKWSTMKIDENDVSDVYVRLGNDFNAAVAAFTAFGIDMACVLTALLFLPCSDLLPVSCCPYQKSCVWSSNNA